MSDLTETSLSVSRYSGCFVFVSNLWFCLVVFEGHACAQPAGVAPILKIECRHNTQPHHGMKTQRLLLPKLLYIQVLSRLPTVLPHLFVCLSAPL